MARGPGILELARMANPFSPRARDGDGSSTATLPRPQEREAVERNPHFEALLCRAVARRRLVELRYDGDRAPRLFAPHAVYESTQERLNVSGVQYENPGQPGDRNETRAFQVGLIRTLRLTDTYFRPDLRIAYDDPRFRNGIVCSVSDGPPES